MASRLPTIRFPTTAATGAVAMAGLAAAVTGTPAFRRQISEACPDLPCGAWHRPTEHTLLFLDRLGVGIDGYTALMAALVVLQLGVYGGLGLLLLHRGGSRLAAASGMGLASVGLRPLVSALSHEGRELAAATDALLMAAIQIFLFVVLAWFPDGRWHPRWLRLWWPLFVAAMIIPAILRSIEVDLGEPLGTLEMAPTLFLIGAQVHRYLRVSDWAARQQTNWVLTGLLVIAANAVTVNAFYFAGIVAQWHLAFVLIDSVGSMILGVGFTLALLRYRLFEVTVVLRRTALYAGAVVGLLVAYLALVALASLSMAQSSASILGGVTVAAVAFGAGLGLVHLRGWFRDRLLGTRGRPDQVASLLAQKIVMPHEEGPAQRLAETTAQALGLGYVALRGFDGGLLSMHGTAGDEVFEATIDNGSGVVIATLTVSPMTGERLTRSDHRAIREVIPFVMLVLRARQEAIELREAQVVAESAREVERRRLRRDLHDGIGPLLAGQLLSVDSLRVGADRGLDTGPVLADLESQTRSALAEIRRISRGLHPSALEDGGLAVVMAAEAERLRSTGLKIDWRVELDGRALPTAVEVAALRIMQEALTNIVRHAQAQRVQVEINVVDETLALLVDDDGIGRGRAEPGIGTVSMRERATELGGSLTIDTGSQGRGTRIQARLPL